MPLNPRTLRPSAARATPQFSPAGYTRLWCLSENATGTISGSASSDSGKYAVKWWDNTTDIYDSGDPFSKSAAGGKRVVEVYPAAVAQTSLLLHFDGANGSTAFTDSSPNALTVTANGDAQISTAQSKFGGASGYFDGAGDYLEVASSDAQDFGTGDFTIEMWLRPASAPSYILVSGEGPNGDPGNLHASGWNIRRVYDTLQLERFDGNNEAIVSFGSWSPSNNQWVHLAISRESGTSRAFIDGVLLSAQSDSNDWSRVDNTENLWIGHAIDGNGESYYEGYIDELRIIKGAALYTSNFTPPTGPLSVVSGVIPSGQFDGFDVSGNSLTQVRAEDVALATAAGSYTGTAPGFWSGKWWIPSQPGNYIPGSAEAGNISDNLLSSTALDQFYTDLDAGSGDLFVQGNPGIVDDDPSIATDKGYTVFGSVPPSTVLLLHFDGDDEDTFTTDSSPEGHTITFNGDAQISTAQSKFGGASAYFDGSGDYLSTAAAALTFGSDDFSLEAWIYISASGNNGICGGAGIGPAVFAVDGNGAIFVDFADQGGGIFSSNGAVSTGAWTHVAFTRSSGTVRIFVDGVQVASGSLGAFSAPSASYIGTLNTVEWCFNGFIDELRIVKGAALYTANFTPPTGPLTVYP